MEQEKEFCRNCFREFDSLDIVDKNKQLCQECSSLINVEICDRCKKNKAIEEYWGLCEECWDKDQKEIDKLNRKQWSKTAKEKGMTLKEYMDDYVSKGNF